MTTCQNDTCIWDYIVVETNVILTSLFRMGGIQRIIITIGKSETFSNVGQGRDEDISDGVLAIRPTF